MSDTVRRRIVLQDEDGVEYCRTWLVIAAPLWETLKREARAAKLPVRQYIFNCAMDHAKRHRADG